MLYKAIDPKVEVNGETVLSVVDGCVDREFAVQALERSGITHPKPGQWYPQQAWLNAFKAIGEKMGDATLNVIGRRIPENAQFPPQINDLQKALSAIDMAYHMNHRHGEIGHYTLKDFGEKSAHMVCNNPYPCAFDRGIIDTMANRFKPAGVDFVKVRHSATGPCRSKGGELCEYEISW
jgi:hypothetical protein